MGLSRFGVTALSFSILVTFAALGAQSRNEVPYPDGYREWTHVKSMTIQSRDDGSVIAPLARVTTTGRLRCERKTVSAKNRVRTRRNRSLKEHRHDRPK
jgi:hypothetical protein